MVLCFLAGILLLRGVGSFRAHKTDGTVTPKAAREGDADAADLARRLVRLAEENRPGEVPTTLQEGLRDPKLRTSAAFEVIIAELAGRVKVHAATLLQCEAAFGATGIDFSRDALVDALEERGQDWAVAQLLERTGAERGYVRLASAAVAREDLASAERSVRQLEKRNLTVPAHVATRLLRLALQVRGVRAALELVPAVELSAEGLASVLQFCAQKKDTAGLREAIALARHHQVPVLLCSYEALVRGWAASGDADAAREACRYFEELLERFPLTPASCVAILDTCAGPLALPIARRVLAAAREHGVAEPTVLAAGLRALASGRSISEAADWVADLLEEEEGLDACLMPGLVDACAAAGSWARGRQVVADCVDPAVLDRFLRHASRENWGAASGPTSARGAALGALEDAAARGFEAGPAPYTRAMEALVRSGDRGVAEQLFAQAVARGCADLHAF